MNMDEYLHALMHQRSPYIVYQASQTIL